MSIALIPGSFDPPTLGHLDVIERATQLTSHLYIGLAENPNKKASTFAYEKRFEFLQKITEHLPTVEVVMIKGVTFNFAKEYGVEFLIRGLRAFSDMQYEFQMALANKKIGNIETIFLVSEGKYALISASLIREVALTGHHLKDFIPKIIEQEVASHLAIKT